jgi:hypothetical protein
MTISELIAYLAQYCEEGKGDAVVTASYHKDNPISDGSCICDIVFIESKTDGRMCVFQME